MQTWAALFCTLAIAVLASGCRRGACESDAVKKHSGQMGPFWSTHRDLIPPSTVVCDYDTNDVSHYESLEFDFEPEPEVPMATVAKFLEEKGWQRQDEKRTDSTFEMVFVKGETQLGVTGLLAHKRTRLNYTWTQKK